MTGLVALLDSGEGTVVIDLARSIDFREGHIPGAIWGVRTRLDALQPQLAGAKHVVITSPDGDRRAARGGRGEGACARREVRVLEGGTDAWHAFGRPLVKDRTTPPDEACIDSYLRAYDRNSGVEEAMHAYLTWEIDLANQIRRDDTVAFGVGEASAASLTCAWRGAGRALLDLLLPPHCVVCDAPVDAPGLLCAECFRQTGFITEPFCARCGVPFANAGAGRRRAAVPRLPRRAAGVPSVPAPRCATTRRGGG